MDPYEPTRPRQTSRRYKRKGTALFTLVLLGCGIIFFSIVLIACSFVVNYARDFQVSTYGGIEEAVQSSFHYTQYWAGVPFIITGILVICSGTFQRNRELTITAAAFCVVSIGVTMFVASLDGPNWSFWDAQSRSISYYESQDGINCVTENEKCVCKTTVSGNTTTVKTLNYECDEMSELKSLYGAIVGSAILIALICAFALLTITKTLSWKRILGHRRRIYYDYDDILVDNAPRGNVVAMENRRDSRPPSFVDLPYTKRGEFVDAPSIAAQLPPRQFSYRSSNRGNPY